MWCDIFVSNRELICNFLGHVQMWLGYYFADPITKLHVRKNISIGTWNARNLLHTGLNSFSGGVNRGIALIDSKKLGQIII